MALVLATIKERVRVESKDAIDRFADIRESFIKETCLEISKHQDYHWLQEATTATVPATKTDWFNLDSAFYNVLMVHHRNTEGESKFFQFIRESDYIYQSMEVRRGYQGYFRIRYNNSTDRWQMCLVNGPEAGETIDILIKKVTDDVTKFPSFMSEAVVKGAVMRFLKFQEGDDLDSALTMEKDYYQLCKQEDMLGDDKLSQKPRRVKTVNELYNAEANNRYGSR